MIERPDVDTLLAGPLGGWLQEQTAVREEAKRIAADRWWKAALIGLPILAFCWIALPAPTQLKMFLSAGIAGLGYAWGNAPRAKAIKAVKEGINEAIARALALNYADDFAPGRGFGLACDYELLPRHDRSRFEDLWSGEVGGRGFALHEAQLEQRRKSGDNGHHYVTVFRGAIMTIDFAREFHGITLLQRAGTNRGFFGGRKETITLNGHRLDYVDMVHPGFEDSFDLWSDDQVEARYLVHPAYVERLLGLEQAFHGKDIRALFSGGALVIVIETGNMFESGSIEARDDRARIARTIEQFASLADLAEALNEPRRGFS